MPGVESPRDGRENGEIFSLFFSDYTFHFLFFIWLATPLSFSLFVMFAKASISIAHIQGISF